MRLMSAILAGFLAVATLGAAPPAAMAQDCQSLWVERNTYYKQAGYCFRTARAIQYFGNDGCYLNSEPNFPYNIRQRIQQLLQAERAYGCPR